MIKVYKYSGGIKYIYIYMHLDMKKFVCACVKKCKGLSAHADAV
jgi:hypothetical protein